MAVPDTYRGREQTFVKHTLLRKYLDGLGHKVGHRWNCIDYVDCFAGPWQSSDPDFRDTSFGIAVDTLSGAQRHLQEIGKNLRLRFCFVESDKKSFVKLKAYAELRRDELIEIAPLDGEFENQLERVKSFLRSGGDEAFRFLLIDPKGWTGFALNKIAPLVERRFAEILVTVMTSHIRRFVTKQAHAEQFEELFGDSNVVSDAAPLQGAQRERFLVRRYAENLKSRAGLFYTSTAAILKAEQDSVHYYLVFGTNSPHGVEVFKQAEQTAFEVGESARDEAKLRKRENRTGQKEFLVSFDGPASASPIANDLRVSYLKEAREFFDNLTRPGKAIAYDSLLGTILQTPLVWKADLDDWIHEGIEAGRIKVTPLLGRKKLRLSQSYRICGTS